MRPALFVLLGIGGLLFSPALAGTPVVRHQLADSVIPAVRKSTVVAPASGSEVLYLAVSLYPRYPAELKAFCDSVSDPRSPSYRQFMTPDQVGESFGASASDVDNVVAFLKSKGMRITLVAKNRMAVLATATVAQAEAAFSTKIALLEGPDPAGHTVTYQANTTPLSMPANVAEAVVGVSGIETYARPIPRTTLLNPTLTRGLYATAPAYALGFQGQGRTIGISNFDGLRLSNAPLYIADWGLPVPAGGAGSNISIVTMGSPAYTGAPHGEGDLDFQMELGMAPLANIVIYDNDGNAYISLLAKEANDNLCDVISESYGWDLNSSDLTSAHNQHLAMTAQGMTYLVATGDYGTDYAVAAGYYPNIDPEPLMIGGTCANVNGTTGTRVSEDGWNGSGGGWYTTSASYNVLPSWQHGNGVPTSINYRLWPDFSLHSSGSTSSGGAGAYSFRLNGTIRTTYAGTSFASPVCAGAICILEQRLAANGQTARLGRMQDMIYAENGRSDVWYDILTGNNSNPYLPDHSQSTAHAGWDTVTGWGAPNFDAWYTALAAVDTVPSGYQINYGTYASGNVASLANVDQNYLAITERVPPNLRQPPVDITVSGTTTILNPSRLDFQVVAHSNQSNITQEVKLYNVSTASWQSVDTRTATNGSDQTVLVSVTSNAAQFVAADGTVRARVTYTPQGPTLILAWSGSIDQTKWRLTP
ncbi:MAG TPA: protease pro-enzyme activation domain-containing protein [Fimbriimonadaceae bacterium]|nr:protease pro-enzyme activation domain-containing protein [Fimbriimonadaceae bacterium]